MIEYKNKKKSVYSIKERDIDMRIRMGMHKWKRRRNLSIYNRSCNTNNIFFKALEYENDLICDGKCPFTINRYEDVYGITPVFSKISDYK